jgi:hypothetical protein
LVRGLSMAGYFRLRDSVVHEQFGDETVVVNLETGCYYSLQKTAGAVWALATSGQSRSHILDRVCATFSGERSKIVSDTGGFLDELVAEQLLDSVEDAELSNGKPSDISGCEFVTPCLQKYTDMEELLLIDPIHEIDEVGWPSARPPTR